MERSLLEELIESMECLPLEIESRLELIRNQERYIGKLREGIYANWTRLVGPNSIPSGAGPQETQLLQSISKDYENTVEALESKIAVSSQLKTLVQYYLSLLETQVGKTRIDTDLDLANTPIGCRKSEGKNK